MTEYFAEEAYRLANPDAPPATKDDEETDAGVDDDVDTADEQDLYEADA